MKVEHLNKITFREANKADIKQIQIVRNSVTENTLTNPELITDADCLEFITNRGKGWVCENDNQIIGFSIADLKENNVWALFVHPNYDKQGIGRQLHDLMLNWYFDQTSKTIWLGTAPSTRAEIFYRKLGWVEVGIHGKGEIKFEMTFENWKNKMKLNAGIITEKLIETKEFYTHVLNFGVSFENEFYLLMHTPDESSVISFLKPNHPSQKPIFQSPFNGKGAYLTIEVEKVDKVYQQLKNKGVVIEIEIRDEPWGDRHFAIVDPNGIGIDIVTYTKPEE